MKSDVYYFTARTFSHKQSLAMYKGPLALEKIGFNNKVQKSDSVVIKTHFGALENVRYLRPSYIRFLCDYVKDLGAIPSVAESCGWGVPEVFTGIHTEYSGRSGEEEYLETAKKHGFTNETMGAELLMLDGKVGADIIRQSVNGKRFKEVLVAGRMREFDHMIMATHFKGHAGAGFGGALKNLGIGCVSKGGKVQAHMGKKFEFDFNAPISDYEACLKICPTNALREGPDGKLIRDKEKCRYCYMCKSVCKNKVIDTGSSTEEEFITQMIDNAVGVVDYFGKDKIFYLNYVIDVTWQCDCTGGSDIPFVSDIGILSSLDPVAVDQSAVDLIHLSEMNPHSILGKNSNISKESPHNWLSYLPRFDPVTGKMDLNPDGKESKNWEIQLKAAEDIGLGSRDYNLIEVSIENEKKN